MDLDARIGHFVSRQRVAHLATNQAGSAPHVVPIVFAFVDGRCYTAVDEKPKRTPRLQRLRNIEADPRATLLVDVYDEDWVRLGWVMLRGRAEVVADPAERERAVEALRAKYPQYRTAAYGRLDGAIIRFTPERAASWGALEGAGGA